MLSTCVTLNKQLCYQHPKKNTDIVCHSPLFFFMEDSNEQHTTKHFIQVFPPQMKVSKGYLRLDLGIKSLSGVSRRELLGSTDFSLNHLGDDEEVIRKGLYHPWHNPVRENPATRINRPERPDDAECDWNWTNSGTVHHWAFVLLCLSLIYWSGQLKLINFPSHDFITATQTTLGAGFCRWSFLDLKQPPV